jgi:hypothetical protein
MDNSNEQQSFSRYYGLKTSCTHTNASASVCMKRTSLGCIIIIIIIIVVVVVVVVVVFTLYFYPPVFQDIMTLKIWNFYNTSYDPY